MSHAAKILRTAMATGNSHGISVDATDLCKLVPRGELSDELAELLAEDGGSVDIATEEHQSRVNGRVVCRSNVHKLRDRIWRLALIETDPEYRSHGVGSAHLRTLIDRIKEEDPSACALFFEIESRWAERLRPSARRERERRYAFYERLGAHVWDGTLLMPSDLMPVPGRPLCQMELMWFQLTDQPIRLGDIRQVVRDVMCQVGRLETGDPLVSQVVHQDFPLGIPEYC